MHLLFPPMVLVHLPPFRGEYILTDVRTRRLIFGPFFSTPDALWFAQSLANQTKRVIWQESWDENGQSTTPTRAFRPVGH
jgi:hypothetical protein